jgi:aryl sulfotransferase
MPETISPTPELPVRSRVYQNVVTDSTRWNLITLRDDDIVIATSQKSGTTWMQGIVANLIFLGQDLPAPPMEMSPWLDMRVLPLEQVLTVYEQQKHRRFIKTHLPLDGLRYDSRVKYVYIGRDVRDVFMSLWNHVRNFSDAAITAFNTTPGRLGPGLQPFPDDIHEYWRTWIAGDDPSMFPLPHVRTWWDYRHVPNILLIHYADLLADFRDEAERVADFLEIKVPEAVWPSIMRNCTLSEMRAAHAGTERLNTQLKGGAETFFYKGTNGRWREVLSAEELALYDRAAKRELTRECRQWLETGRRGADLPK